MIRKQKWVRNSLASFHQKTKIFNYTKKFKEEAHRRESKHTFFPGNEILGNRILKRDSWIIDSDSYSKILWDLILLILTVIISFMIPYYLSFNSGPPRYIWLCSSTIFLFDSILSFNTSFFHQGWQVLNRKSIINNYIHGWFLIDIFSSFPVELLIWDNLNSSTDPSILISESSPDYLRYLLMLKMLRLIKFRQVVISIEDFFSSSIVFRLTSIFNYLFAAIFTLHIMTCAFNSLFVQSLQTSYFYSMSQYNQDWSRYLRFLLRSMETMTSVGYGENPVKTLSEKVFTMIAMALTSGLLGYFVGGLQSSLEKSNQTTYFFRDTFLRTKMYCNLNNIPPELQKKVINYLRNLKLIYANDLIKEQDILHLLSGPMRGEIFTYIRGRYVEKFEVLNSLSNASLKAIGYKLRLQVFAPNDLIIKQGELTNELYFVIGGGAEVFHSQTLTSFKLLTRFSHFGEISFFLNTPRAASIKSCNYSEFLILRQLDFINILKGIPKDNEKVKVLERNVRNYGLVAMNIRCYLCSVIGHCAINCDNTKITKNFTYLVNRTKFVSVNSTDSARRAAAAWGDTLKRYNVNSTHGTLTAPKVLFSDNTYLASKAEKYDSWVHDTDKKNSKFLSLISSIVEEEEKEEDDSILSKDSSDSSRDNYIQFEMSRTGKFQRIFSSDSLNSLLNSKGSALAYDQKFSY